MWFNNAVAVAAVLAYPVFGQDAPSDPAPDCAIQAGASILTVDGCSLGDLSCTCASEQFIHNVPTELLKVCDADDTAAVENTLVNICAQAGVAISFPDPHGASSSASSSPSSSEPSSSTAASNSRASTSASSPTESQTESSVPSAEPTTSSSVIPIVSSGYSTQVLPSTAASGSTLVPVTTDVSGSTLVPVPTDASGLSLTSVPTDAIQSATAPASMTSLATAVTSPFSVSPSATTNQTTGSASPTYVAAASNLRVEAAICALIGWVAVLAI